MFQKRATLHHLGDITIVLSKKRRNAGPNQVRLFVTNLQEVNASTVLSLYAWRWGVEATIKELKSSLHLGQMQVTRDANRVARSVALSVCAYLLLVRLYRTERKWQLKLKQYEDAA